MKNKVKQQSLSFLLVSLFSWTLASCGASGKSFTIAPEPGASSSYEFGEAFRSGSLGVYSSGVRLALVEETMLSDFHTDVLTFDEDLSCPILYEGHSLPWSYRVSSTYTLDKAHYTFTIGQEQLTVTLNGNPSKTDLEFVMPSYLESVPAPLNAFPVTAWKASFGGMGALERIQLSKVVSSFEPSVLPASLAILPYSYAHPLEQGKLDYDANGFLSWGKTLYGIQPSFQGALVLPSADAAFSPNAFALPLPGVSQVEIPDGYASLDFSLASKNLPANQGFSCDLPPKGYAIAEGFVYYSDGDDTFVRGIPLGRFQKASRLVFPSGLTRFLLGSIDGLTLSAAKDVVLPATVTSFSAVDPLTDSSLETLEFTSPELVRTTSLSVKNLPASLKRIVVPAALLASYQANAVWRNAAVSFVGA
jgi:hypothetical protein